MGLDPNTLPDSFLSKMPKDERALLNLARREVGPSGENQTHEQSTSVVAGGAQSAENTRQFTNLVPSKTTDEQKLNKLERDWLRVLRLTHPRVGIQDITLKLADDTRYTADFNVVDANGQLVFYETKGPQYWDDAKVKLKVAARSFLHFRFILVQRNNGQWIETPVNP